MKMLHPIGLDEQMIARGEYNYQVAGKDSGLTETWLLHQLPDNSLIHRAEVRGRVAGLRLKQTTYFGLSPAYRPTRLEMRQEIDGNITDTTIRCFAESLMQSITTETETEKNVIESPADYGLFFPPVSGHGFILAGYDAVLGGRQSLPLASVRIQPENALPLSIETQIIDYEKQGDEEVETPAGQFACQHYIRYDQHMEQHIWLDSAMIPVQWSVPYSPIMKWEYLLIRYQREK